METEKVIEIQRENEVEQDVDMLNSADEISREKLLQMLLKKGGATADEMVKLEERIKEVKAQQQNISFVKIKNPYDRGKFPSLKRVMSKNRWSRKIGTQIFGWKWKKVKKVSSFS